MNTTRVLWKCTEDALDSLGEKDHADNFDISRFAVVLNELLGTGSETILNMICRNLCEYLKADFPADPRTPALEKISIIMETKKMN